MPDSDYQRYVLACLRFASECRLLAADTPSNELKDHFLRMAGMWDELAFKPRADGIAPNSG